MKFKGIGNKVKYINIDNISISGYQPRKIFGEQDIIELAKSIKQNGIIQPIVVRKELFNTYELIAGERRVRACKAAGITNIPAVVVDCSDEQALVISLIENLQRVDLNPFEEAEGIDSLIRIWGLTQEDIAKKLGKKQSTVCNKLRLLQIDEEDRKLLIDAALSERHARAVLKLKDNRMRKLAIHQIIDRGLNVSQSEQLAQKLLDECLSHDKYNCKRTVIVKDVRIFINTITKAVDTMRLSGIEAKAEQKETEDYIECIVRIPKAKTFSKINRTA